MKNNSEDKLEQVISEALLLHDQGESVEMIIRKFPSQEKELAEVFRAIKILDQEKEKFAPSESLLRKILRALPDEGLAKAKAGFFSPIFSFFEWPGLPYAVGVATFLLIVTFGVNWYNAPKNIVTKVVNEQTVSLETTTSSAEEVTANLEKDTAIIEKNVNSLKTELNNFESELSEIEKLASDESFKDLDALLLQIDNEIM